VPAHDEQRVRNTHYSRITCYGPRCPGQVRHVDNPGCLVRRHTCGNLGRPGAIPASALGAPRPWAGYTRGMMQEPGRYVLPFPDRRAAGRLLGERLEGAVELRNWAERTLVLGLPRGGVAVAEQVAAVLAVPMNVMVTRKIGYPRQPELGVGAIAEIPGAAGCGPPVYDRGLLSELSITPADLAAVLAAEEAELTRRVRVYRGGRALPRVAGWCVIVVDDGLATGATARAALRSLREAQAAHLVLAVPVAPASAATAMLAEADQVIVLATPRLFSSVGEWYTSFGQLSDADVLALLTESEA
jgi:putative phosphoribosyl transferase